MNQHAPTHRHRKSGGFYRLLGVGKMQAEQWFDEIELTVDMAEVAIYQSLEDQSMWVRPLAEFNDGRFEDLRAIEGDGQDAAQAREDFLGKARAI